MSSISHHTVRTDVPAPGPAFPLGATAAQDGTQFAVHSPEADGLEICLVDPDGGERRVELHSRTFGVWHGFVPGVEPGTTYGIRAHGQWDPARGRRFNDRKLLLDPSARQITGHLGSGTALLPYDDEPFGRPSEIDSLGHVPLAVVTAASDTVDTRPRVPWDRTVLYELHVGAYTARHPGVPAEHRGTYLGLTAPSVLEHLTRIGVTSVELLPVHASLTEPDVRARGMRNHWGYSTGAYFAPDPRFASQPGREISEFKAMVKALHEVGIEVVLDVVYNHTCESSVSGPSISWRGLDAPGYYLLDGRGHDVDLTGCGNTLDSASPAVVRMVCDSLRYWVTEMGVDGFRFDLASTLGRPGGWRFDARAPLLTAITTDPVLSTVKLIAEPWDATGAGYQVGGFGGQWSEWNDRYRDTVRRFWAGQTGVRELASRLAGSEDIYGGGVRKPWASINFVTAHDGFTVRDLVSYSHKHNEANGEENRDGTDNNISVNHGIEGDTDDPAVRSARAAHTRALLATLALSTGTPMLLAGDELGHSQFGNNNAYCVPQDASAADAWAVDWSDVDSELIAFVARVLRVRRAAPSLRQQEFFIGRDTPSGRPDLVWFDSSGEELSSRSWNDDSVRTMQAWVDGADVRSYDPDGHPVDDASSLLVVHAGGETDVVLACPPWAATRFVPVFDSSTPDGVPADASPVEAGSPVHLSGSTVLVLRSDGR